MRLHLDSNCPIPIYMRAPTHRLFLVLVIPTARAVPVGTVRIHSSQLCTHSSTEYGVQYGYTAPGVEKLAWYLRTRPSSLLARLSPLLLDDGSQYHHTTTRPHLPCTRQLQHLLLTPTGLAFSRQVLLSGHYSTCLTVIKHHRPTCLFGPRTPPTPPHCCFNTFLSA